MSNFGTLSLTGIWGGAGYLVVPRRSHGPPAVVGRSPPRACEEGSAVRHRRCTEGDCGLLPRRDTCVRVTPRERQLRVRHSATCTRCRPPPGFQVIHPGPSEKISKALPFTLQSSSKTPCTSPPAKFLIKAATNAKFRG